MEDQCTWLCWVTLVHESTFQGTFIIAIVRYSLKLFLIHYMYLRSYVQTKQEKHAFSRTLTLTNKNKWLERCEINLAISIYHIYSFRFIWRTVIRNRLCEICWPSIWYENYSWVNMKTSHYVRMTWNIFILYKKGILWHNFRQNILNIQWHPLTSRFKLSRDRYIATVNGEGPPISPLSEKKSVGLLIVY